MKQNARSDKSFTLNAHMKERLEQWENLSQDSFDEFHSHFCLFYEISGDKCKRQTKRHIKQ